VISAKLSATWRPNELTHVCPDSMQERAGAQASGSDGLVAVRINNDWYLFSRAAAPVGHEQVGGAECANLHQVEDKLGWS
jgi:hypothetical protein